MVRITQLAPGNYACKNLRLIQVRFSGLMLGFKFVFNTVGSYKNLKATTKGGSAHKSVVFTQEVWSLILDMAEQIEKAWPVSVSVKLLPLLKLTAVAKAEKTRIYCWMKVGP